MGQIVGWSLALAPATAALEARVYQAVAEIQPPPAALRGRIYQAYATVRSGGVGAGRIYQAYATVGLPVGYVPSGIQARRGGNLATVMLRADRNGAL
jgi:hypothetical protein